MKLPQLPGWPLCWSGAVCRVGGKRVFCSKAAQAR